jgi:hypothetical protein
VRPQGGVHVHEQDPARLELFLGLVVHDLALVLRADAAEVVLLGLRDAELVPGRFDLGRHVLPRPHPFHGLDVVVDVVEIDVGEVGAPARHRLAIEDVERPVTVATHPVGLALAVAHHVDDFVRYPLAGSFPVGDVVVPAVLVGALEGPDLFVLLEDLEVLGFRRHPETSSFFRCCSAFPAAPASPA